jgi:glutamine phosphoribosylpyrophosphate amidotransferase
LTNILDGKAVVTDSFCETTNSSYLMYNAVLEGDETQISRIYQEIDRQPGLCVHSLGQSVMVAKDLGDAENLANVRFINNFSAFHGIGHVRLATESIDNLNFAHPFTSEIFPLLSIVHNGQLTNYFNLRRRLERAGVSFKTKNDSELIAHYIARLLSRQGKTLQEALEQAIEDLDGVYSCLVATDREIGAFQDRLGLKPILVCELPDMVLFGSERICFTPITVEAGASWEIKPGEARTWSH